jgi:TPP-dependent trihydroxycyclohexane-1,2-dione (THcHDO) dehydratase
MYWNSYFLLYNDSVDVKLTIGVVSLCFSDEAQEAEAVQVLNSVFDMREHQTNRQPEDMARVSHALAMLYYVLGDISKVSCL